MHLFRYARDYYGPEQAQQLLLAVAVLSIAVVLLFIAVHLLRRSGGPPASSDRIFPVDGGADVTKYEIGARLYHWGNLVFLLGLVVSGLALLAPGELRSAPWLRLHEIFAGLFTFALALHVVVAPWRGNARSMWIARGDWTDLRLTIANFFGLTRRYPAFGKYDPWQKLYHALLALLSIAAIGSGVYLLFSAEVWATFSHQWMRQVRLVHDAAAFVFVAIVVGHTYFGIIRVNWPQLGAMITGRLSREAFHRHHDGKRWDPREKTAGGD